MSTLGMVVHDALNGESVYAYVTDPLGTVRNVVGDAGTVSNSYTYKAFGEVRNKTEGVSNPYLFTGRRWNSDIQEYYYRARNYMPDMWADSGRWIGMHQGNRPMGMLR